MVSPSISHVYEAQDTDLFQTLKFRLNMVGKFKGLGPPDMVYLVKEKRRGLFKGKIEVGSYHYVYGIYPDSSAVPAAYLRTLIDSQEKGCKIRRGIFAMYDIVSKKDIRVEIEIPGKCHVYSQGQEGRSEISKNEWSFGFMSSILRSIVEPLPHPACRIHDPFPDTQRFDGFRQLLQAFVNFTAAQKQDLSLYFGKQKDPVQACDRLFGLISRYLVSQRRINDLVNLCNPILNFEPNLSALMCDGLIQIYVFQESLTALATQLSHNPYLVPCLVREAKVFLAMDDADYEAISRTRPLLKKHSNLSMALRISRICVDLCPQSFECWLLLGSALLLSKRFEQVLLILNTIPVADEMETIDGRLSTEDTTDSVIDFNILKHSLTQPRLISSSASHSILFRKPRYRYIQSFFHKYVQQFEKTKESVFTPNQETHCKQQEAKQIKRLLVVNNIAINKRILKSYRLLLALERVIGKEPLLRIKAKLFSGGKLQTSKGASIDTQSVPRRDFLSHSTTILVDEMMRREEQEDKYRFLTETEAPPPPVPQFRGDKKTRHSRSNSYKSNDTSMEAIPRHQRSMTVGGGERVDTIPTQPS